MRILGLDVGSKTIGVAISDQLGLCAHSLCTLKRKGTAADAEQILALYQKWSASSIVVGLPYDCEGNEGHRAIRVRVLGDALASRGISIEYYDESFSTVEAEEILLQGDVSRKRRKQVIDQLAAAVILQHFLEQLPKSNLTSLEKGNEEK